MRANIEGLEIEYSAQGQGPDLLMLHGWGGKSDHWLRVAQILRENFTVWLLDLPGFGQSQNPPSTWGAKDYARLVDSFIRKQDLTNIILLGHSFGGMLAIDIARKNPTYLRKLILVSSAGIRLRMNFSAKLIRLGTKLVKGFLILLPQNPQEKVEQALLRLLSREGVEYAKYPILRPIFKRTVEQNLEPFLQDIQCPTLIIAGENDRIVPVSYAKIMNEKIKNSTLKIVPGAGHFPFLEKPNEFLMILKEWLNV